MTVQVINLARTCRSTGRTSSTTCSDLRGSGGSIGDIGRNVDDLAKELAKEPPATQPASQPAADATAPATNVAGQRDAGQHPRPGRDAAPPVAKTSEPRSACAVQKEAAATRPDSRRPRDDARETHLHAGRPPRARTPLQILGANLGRCSPAARHGRPRHRVRDLHAAPARGPARPPDPARRPGPDPRHHHRPRRRRQRASAATCSRRRSSTARTASAIAIGLWLIGKFVGDGMPFPSVVLWGLLCAVLRFIPYIGPWIAAAFPIALSLAVYHELRRRSSRPSCMFVVIELLSNNIMEPWLYGTQHRHVDGRDAGVGGVLDVAVGADRAAAGDAADGLPRRDRASTCRSCSSSTSCSATSRCWSRPRGCTSGCWRSTRRRRRSWRTSYLKETLARSRCTTRCCCRRWRWPSRTGTRASSTRSGRAFISQAMRDMIDELGDAARRDGRAAGERRHQGGRRRQRGAREGPGAGGHAARRPRRRQRQGERHGGAGPAVSGAATVGADLAAIPGERPLLPKGCTVNVVCLPARDDGDDIANIMLAQLLDLRGYCAFAIPVAALASEMVDAVDEAQGPRRRRLRPAAGRRQLLPLPLQAPARPLRRQIRWPSGCGRSRAT